MLLGNSSFVFVWKCLCLHPWKLNSILIRNCYFSQHYEDNIPLSSGFYYCCWKINCHAQILVFNTILQKKEPELLEEMVSSKIGQNVYRMILEHLAIPESRWENKTKKHSGCGVWRTKIYIGANLPLCLDTLELVMSIIYLIKFFLPVSSMPHMTFYRAPSCYKIQRQLYT